jgi:hypothetical protein
MGYVQFMKPLTVEAIQNKVNASISHLANMSVMYQKVIPVLAPFAGKAISKRMETAMKKALPDYVVSMNSGLSTVISIWGNGIDYENRISCYLHTLGFNNGGFDYQKFVDGCNIAGLEKSIKQLQDGYNGIEGYVNRYNTLLQQSQELVSESAAYGMEYDFDLALNARK